jgi:opacity protein-like surface antigen
MKQLLRRAGCHSAWIGGTAIAVVVTIVGTASLSQAFQPDHRGIGTDPYYAKGPGTDLETYVKVFGGVTFAGRFRNLEATGGATHLSEDSLALTSSFLYGMKLGVFPWRWVGLEVEAFNTSTHTKQQAETFTLPANTTTSRTLPGIDQRVTVLAFNTIVRYPGKQYQPYIGIGPGLFFMQSDLGAASVSNTTLGLNAMAGLNVRVNEHLGLFAEYKYDWAEPHFDNLYDLGRPNGHVGFKGVYSNNAIVAGVGWHF